MGSVKAENETRTVRCQSGEVGETSYVCTFYKLRDCPPTPYLLAHVLLDAYYVTSEMEVVCKPY